MGLVGAAAGSAPASEDCHLRAGVLRRWARYDVEKTRRAEEGRTMCLQHRAATCEGIAMAADEDLGGADENGDEERLDEIL